MFQPKALHQQEDLHTEAESSRGKLFLRRGSSTGKQRSASPTSVASKGARRRASSVERLLDLFRGRSYNELEDDDARKHDDALSARAPDAWAWPHLRETGFNSSRRATVDGAARSAPAQPKKSPRRIRSLGDILQARRRRDQAGGTALQTRSAQNSASTTPTTSAASTQASSILVRERSVHLSALQEGDRDPTLQQESVANKRDEFGRQTSLQKLWSMTQSVRPASASSSEELDDDTSTDDGPDRDSDDEQEQKQQQQQPDNMQRAFVRVPQNAVPGDRVLARLKNGRQVSFEIPSGAFPGDMLVLTLPHIVHEETL